MCTYHVSNNCITVGSRWMKKTVFYTDELLAPRPTSSAVSDFIFITFAATPKVVPYRGDRDFYFG